MQFTAFCKVGQAWLRKSRVLALLTNQNLRLMKLTIFLLLGACIQASAGSYAQGITLKVTKAPIEKVFKQITEQTGITFLYNDQLLQHAVPVTIDATNGSLENVLNKCFQHQPLKYEIINNTVVVSQKEEIKEKERRDTTRTIRGIVSSEGRLIAGVSVSIKGSNRGTFTNSKGEYELSNVGDNNVLVFSSVGYQPVEILPIGRSVINTFLKIAIGNLDEAVVVAYGTTTKRLNTGNVSKVTSAEIEKQPVSNPLQALQGRVPGLYIQQNSGVPGSAFVTIIRGVNSISGNGPFFIIDGVPFTSTSLASSYIGNKVTDNSSPLNSLNPSDIESIEILKDADATAIYGSRGATGVILITTKKGTIGKLKSDFNIYTGVGDLSRTMDLLNTKEYLMMRHEAFRNDNATPQPWDYDLNGTWDTTKYTDWQKELIGYTAHFTDAQTSIYGGNANTQFRISGGYYKETTVFPGTFGLQKGSLHFNINTTSNDQKFKAIFNSNYITDRNNLFNEGFTFYALSLPPITPDLMDKNGNLLWPQGIIDNPYKYLKRKNKSTTNNFVNSAALSYKVLPFLQLKADLGYTKIQRDEIITNPLSSFKPNVGYTSANTFSNFANSNVETWIVEPQIEFKQAIGKGKFAFLIGSTFQESVAQGQSIQATNFSSEGLMENIQAASSTTVLNANYALYRYNAFFGRISYNIQDKYLISLSGRRDGSSRFGPGKQFSNFGAIGTAWIFTNENFIKEKFPALSFGKLRMSYGSTGSDQIGDYQYLGTWSITSYPYQSGSGLFPSRLVNTDYRWELNRKLEASLDLGLAKDRILFSLAWYRNRSSNQLIGYSLAPTTGFATIQSNFPALIQNTGFELELKSINIQTKNFNWSTNFNITIPKNKLVSFPNLASYSSYANQYEVGQPLTIKKAFHFIGVNAQTGIYQFQTKNIDGIPSIPNDLLSLKDISQKYYGGLSNSFQYRGFQLDVFFQIVKQTGYNYLNGIFAFPGAAANQPTFILDRWQKPGDVSNVQMFSQSFSGPAIDAYFRTVNYGDNRIGNASFIRLKNLAFSYHIPQRWKEKIHLQDCKIYIQGQNLLTITNYLGLDPESQNTFSLPPLRVLTAGIQFTF